MCSSSPFYPRDSQKLLETGAVRAVPYRNPANFFLLILLLCLEDLLPFLHTASEACATVPSCY